MPQEPDSVEAAVAELRAALPQLVEEVHRAPSDAAARDDLKQKLASLRDDADLIGDPDLVSQVDGVLAELEAGNAASLAAAVGAMADTSAPLPAISEETQRLLATDGGRVRPASFSRSTCPRPPRCSTKSSAIMRRCTENPGDREALRTVRRGFHTLKGSGRMVGLTDLGDYAYEAEKIFNRLLEEERPVTTAVLSLVSVAQKSFRGWVDALRFEGRVTADPAALNAAIAIVRARAARRRSAAPVERHRAAACAERRCARRPAGDASPP